MDGRGMVFAPLPGHFGGSFFAKSLPPFGRVHLKNIGTYTLLGSYCTGATAPLPHIHGAVHVLMLVPKPDEASH